MPISANPNVIQAEMRYTQDQQQVENILHFDVGVPATGADCATLADELIAWWDAAISPLQVQQVALNEVYCKVMVNGSGPEGSSSTGLPSSGQKTDGPMPNNVTLSISFRTGFTGRSRRGRNYILGLGRQDVFESEVFPSVALAWTGAYEQLLAGAGTITVGEWCVYSQWSGGLLRPVGLSTIVLDAVIHDTTVDSQRRRLPGRGQ